LKIDKVVSSSEKMLKHNLHGQINQAGFFGLTYSLWPSMRSGENVKNAVPVIAYANNGCFSMQKAYLYRH